MLLLKLISLISKQKNNIAVLFFFCEVHQDLKPSNWVFESEYTDSELVLIDFGTADIINENTLGYRVKNDDILRTNLFIFGPF